MTTATQAATKGRPKARTRTALLKTRPYDSANYLTDDASIVAYLEEILESGDPALVSHALGVVARAKGMAQIARDAGVSREHLYRALSAEGNPEFGTVYKVIRALGLTLSVSPGTPDHEPARLTSPRPAPAPSAQSPTRARA